MAKHIFFLTVLVQVFLSCNSNSSSNNFGVKNLDSTHKNQLDDKTKSIEQYCYIDQIFEKNGTTFIDADYIQFLTGDAAIEAAKKAHQADTFQTEDGKTHIEVPDDYFIVNESKKMRQIPLSKDCVFDLLISLDRTEPIKDNSLNSLKKIHNDSPFILKMNEKGIIEKIKEVFLP